MNRYFSLCSIIVLPFWIGACMGPPKAEAPKPAAPSSAKEPASAGAPMAERIVEATITLAPDNALRRFEKSKLLGSNIAIWHKGDTFTDPAVVQAFQAAGIGLLRLPGGSASDMYFWNGNGVRKGDQVDRGKYDPKKHTWAIDYSAYKPGFNGFWGFPKDHKTAELGSWHGHVDVQQQLEFTKRVKAPALVTVNAGTGTAKDAAEWVRWVKKTGYDVSYWEVGNELGGSWEPGTLRPDGSTMDGKMYGRIYSEFARAMKAADPSIRVGSQGGVDFIRGALSQKEAPVEFVTFHDYYNAEDSSVAARFKTLDRIRPQIAEVKKAIDELRPGQDIEIGITEYNCKLFEDEGTADVLSGLWTVGAIGEMLYGGLDFATQWDTFTQKREQGGGHGFMIEEGRVPKAQYWSFMLLHRFLGNTLVEVQDSVEALRTYASKDADGNVFLIAINTAEAATVRARVDLGAHRVSPMAEGVRFSRHEYAWDKAAFAPLYNNGLTEFRTRASSRFSYAFPPFSVTALRLAKAESKPVLGVEGPSATVLPNSRMGRVALAAFDADGNSAPGIEVSAHVDAVSGFTVTPNSAVTDAAGVAHFSVNAPTGKAKGSLSLKANGYPEVLHALASVEPELVVHGPARVTTGAVAEFYGAVRYKESDRHHLLHALSENSERTLGSDAEPQPIREGLARFDVSSTKAGKQKLGLRTGTLAGTTEVEFFDTEVRDFMALRFDNQDSLKHASGKMKFSINEAVRPNQGVLELRIPGTSGWAQDAVNIDKFQELPGLDRGNIVGVSLDLMPGSDFSTGGSWASLVLVLQSEANYWMPLTAIDLTELQPGKWKRITVAVDKDEFRPAMKAFFKIVTVVNSGAKVTGSLYLDDLAFSVRTAKAIQ